MAEPGFEPKCGSRVHYDNLSPNSVEGGLGSHLLILQPLAPQGSGLKDTLMPLEEISALRGRGFIFSLELQAQIPPTRNSVSSSTHDPFLTLGPVRYPALRNLALTPVLPPTLLTCGPHISGPPPQGPAARAKAERPAPSHTPTQGREDSGVASTAVGGANKWGRQPDPGSRPHLTERFWASVLAYR